MLIASLLVPAAQYLSGDDSVGSVMPTSHPNPDGAQIGAQQWAECECEAVMEYDWTVEKLVSPSQLELTQDCCTGAEATLTYTVNFVRDDGTVIASECHVDGSINVCNEGPASTVNLAINAEIAYYDGSVWVTVDTFDIDVSAMPVLGMNQEYTYTFSVAFTPVDGVTDYKVIFYTWVDNFLQDDNTVSKDRLKTYADITCCMDDPVIVDYIDETMTLTDDSHVPLGIVVLYDGSPPSSGIQFSDSGTHTYDVVIRNMNMANVQDAVNTIILTEDDTEEVRTDTATVTITSLVPGIDVIKLPDREYAMPGDTVTWTITIYNTGDVDFTHVDVIDNTANIDMGGWDGSLAAGDDVTIHSSYTVTMDDVDIPPMDLVNVVTVTGYVGDCECASASYQSPPVTVVYPLLTVTKTPVETYYMVGELITWNIIITNEGNWAYENIVVSDLLPGVTLLEPVWDHTLDPGEFIAMQATKTATLDDVEASPIVNTISVSGTLVGLGVLDEIEEPAPPVYVMAAGIDVEKTCVTECHVYAGDTIEWSITITNTGSIDLWDIEVTDHLVGVEISFGDWDHHLMPGESVTFSATYQTTMDDDGSFICNSVTVVGYYMLEPGNGLPGGVEYDGFVEDYDEACCILVYTAGIDVTKTTEWTEASVGDTIEWTITIHNTGSVTLYNIEVYDSLAPKVTIDFGTWDYSLDPDESIVLTATMVVMGDDVGTEVENCVEVIGWYGHDDCWESVSDRDCAPVVVILSGEPCITIMKTGPCRAMVGDYVPFTVSVYNCGEVTLYDIVTTDKSDPESPRYLEGLKPGDYWNYTYWITIDVNFCGEYFVNVVEVDGWTDDGLHVWCIDSHAIDIIHPSILIEKYAPEELVWCVEGVTIPYHIVVTNTGDVDLEDVVVHDDMMAEPWVIGYLAEGQWVESFFDVYVDIGMIGDGDMVCNYAWVEGHAGPCSLWCCHDCCFEFKHDWSVYDDALACTFIAMPSMTLEKQASTDLALNDSLVYWYVWINNTGNVPLYVYMNDPFLGETWEGTVMAGESVMLSYDYITDIADADMYDYICNTAYACADYRCCHLEAESTDCLFLVLPDVEIIKTGPTEAVVGGTITYHFVVTNTGNCDLTEVNVTDPLFGVDWYHFIGSLVIGEVVEFDHTIPVPEGVVGPLDNTVTVVGLPIIGDLVILEEETDQDDWVVFIAEPDFSVLKTASVEQSAIGHTIIWTITIYNEGNVELNVHLNDSLISGIGKVLLVADYTIPAFDYITIEIEYVVMEEDVREECSCVVNEACIIATYGDWVGEDCAHSAVFIMMPDFEITKCGPDWAVPGETVVYHITVTNTGNIDLPGLMVCDDDIGWAGVNIVLLVGESRTFDVEFTVPECYCCETFCNTAYALWNIPIAEHEGCDPLYVEDTWCMEIYHPSISILKTGPENAYAGETITFHITVTNTGDVALQDVFVEDPLFYAIGPDYGIFIIGSLDVGATVEFDLTYTIPMDYPVDIDGGELCNFAYVYGYVHGVETMFADGWAVWVMPLDPCEVC